MTFVRVDSPSSSARMSAAVATTATAARRELQFSRAQSAKEEEVRAVAARLRCAAGPGEDPGLSSAGPLEAGPISRHAKNAACGKIRGLRTSFRRPFFSRLAPGRFGFSAPLSFLPPYFQMLFSMRRAYGRRRRLVVSIASFHGAFDDSIFRNQLRTGNAV